MKTFHPESKVWIYQSERPFTIDENLWISDQLELFNTQWAAHNIQLNSFTEIRENQFLIFCVDKSGEDASGCSIDSSVQFVKKVGERFHINFFNRMLMTLTIDGVNRTIPYNELSNAIASNMIEENTVVVNVLAGTKAEFDRHWKILFRDSWAGKKLLKRLIA